MVPVEYRWYIKRHYDCVKNYNQTTTIRVYAIYTFWFWYLKRKFGFQVGFKSISIYSFSRRMCSYINAYGLYSWNDKEYQDIGKYMFYEWFGCTNIAGK